VVNKSGHSLNQGMLKKLIQSSNHWENLVFDHPQDLSAKTLQIPIFASRNPVHA
jgi:UDP-3-O-acyl-N-acetylglucosamine deacetylase